MPYLRTDDRLVAQHANDSRYAHMYWSFPKDHPIRLHDGPGIVALMNPKRRRAYVLAARTQTVHKAADALIGRLRHYMRDLRGDAHHKAYDPDTIKPPRYTSLDLPHDLAIDWDSDQPEAFVWLLADPFPAKYRQTYAPTKDGAAAYKSEVNRRKRAVLDVLERNGWTLYNPNAIRGMARPGARMAYLDQRAAYDEEKLEISRNHLRWVDLLADGGPALEARHNPLDGNVQRAYARHRALIGQSLPKPGDYIPGHKSSDQYRYHLPEGQLTLNCPLDCPRRVAWSTDQTEA